MRYYPDKEDVEEVVVRLMRCIVACNEAENDLWVRERIEVEVESWDKDEILAPYIWRV